MLRNILKNINKNIFNCQVPSHPHPPFSKIAKSRTRIYTQVPKRIHASQIYICILHIISGNCDQASNIFYCLCLPGFGNMLSRKGIRSLMPLVAMVMILQQWSKWSLMNQPGDVFMKWIFRMMLQKILQNPDFISTVSCKNPSKQKQILNFSTKPKWPNTINIMF